MFGRKRFLQGVVLSFAILALIGLMVVPSVQAQYWTALPPYNVLWPLWSSVLSPVNSVTGLPTPLVSQLTQNTVLPVQPVLAWDPSQSLPWALYNTPPILGGGLTYFSPFYGLNPWPPSYLLDSGTGLPAPLGLPVGYGALPPTDVTAGIDVITLGNIQFLLEYPTNLFGIPQSSLLTIADIWGLPLI
ncbi:MAG: hypothetical protein ACMUIL_10305 [bacterium]